MTVKLHVIPMELSDTAIKDVMTQYGTVYNIRDEVYNSEHTYPVRTERKLLRMEVKRPIPSYVMIQHQRYWVTYPGQEKTCIRCHSTEHLHST